MKSTEHSLTTWDGARLFYRAWRPARDSGKALLLFHRGHEHSGRWQGTVDALGLRDQSVFAWDARGHGRSDGDRGAAKSFSDVVKDTDVFVRHISGQFGIPLRNMIVLAHSLSAVNVAAWVHDYAPPIRAMILAAAAFQVKLYVPLAIPALRLRQSCLGPGRVTSYVKAGLLTRDKAEAVRYDADPLIFRQIAVNVLLDLNDTARRVVADAGAITIPTLMICAGRDWIVRLEAQRRFFEQLSSEVKEIESYPQARHAIFHDDDRAAVCNRIRQFVDERFAAPASQPSLLDADQRGHTRAEFDRLNSGGGARFAIARAGLRVAGHLSRGISIGWRSGFDSGLSLDYVYQNRPAGRTPFGQIIDRTYLNSPGWRGVRQRKIRLKETLAGTIERLHRERRPIRVLDIAAGAGRYLLETISEMRHVPITATLRDHKDENVAAVTVLARELGLTNVTACRGDAFDAESIARIAPPPTIGIVSGLYELFPSNEAVRTSLDGLSRAIEPGGYLIYTNQPWHPQLEFIARVLKNREGKPWVMRRRTTAEMDQLVSAAGFTKVSMEIDQWGMFTVSLARREQT